MTPLLVFTKLPFSQFHLGPDFEQTLTQTITLGKLILSVKSVTSNILNLVASCPERITGFVSKGGLPLLE